MDIHNPIIQLCMQGTRAEFEHHSEDARRLYQQAWDSAQDDYERCIAAHYVARFQDTPQDTLHWNQTALDCALRTDNDSINEFLPSLYVNMGHSWEINGNRDKAEEYYTLAEGLGLKHRND